MTFEDIIFLEARVQSRVAKFLALKEPLQKIRVYSPDDSVQQEATTYLYAHETLMGDLSPTLQLLESTKNLATSDFFGNLAQIGMNVATIGAFYTQLETFVNGASGFVDRQGGNVTILDEVPVWLWVGVIGGLVYWFMKKNK